jgi:hypothetical protein
LTKDKDGSGLIDPEEFVPLLTRVLKRPGNSMDKILGLLISPSGLGVLLG